MSGDGHRKLSESNNDVKPKTIAGVKSRMRLRKPEFQQPVRLLIERGLSSQLV
jgi:hypothetical protein